MNDLPTAREWRALTLAPGKREAFSTDLYFRECWTDLSELAGESAASLFSPIALLTFKPDAIAGRRMTPTLAYLAEHGFVPIGVTTVRHTHHSVRELYRFTWDIYTVDRLALATTMHTSRDTLLLMVRDALEGSVPASVRLSELKGSSAPEKRKPDQLRTVLRPPHEIINFVHVADEPADVIRELAIFLGLGERRRLLQRLITADPLLDLRSQVAAEISRQERECEAHDFDFDAALRRLNAAGRLSREDVSRLSSGTKITWREVCSIVEPCNRVGLWDFVCVAARVLELKREGIIDLLPRAGTAEWERAKYSATVGPSRASEGS
jgi:hypothetical protein